LITGKLLKFRKADKGKEEQMTVQSGPDRVLRVGERAGKALGYWS